MFPERTSKTDILSEIIITLPAGKPIQVCIGSHWTAVVMEVEGQKYCGLASTMRGEHHHGHPDVPLAGTLESLTSSNLVSLTDSDSPVLVSVGMAAINALLPHQPETWFDLNAEQVIASKGAGKSVALIGHFPFVDRLGAQVGKLTVLELNPRPGDIPASEASHVIPEAQVVAITGMTLLNRTSEGLLDLCAPDAYVILIGPSVPLHQALFERGVDVLCGSIVTSVDDVLAAVRQGANFRQVHQVGVRLVAIKSGR